MIPVRGSPSSANLARVSQLARTHARTHARVWGLFETSGMRAERDKHPGNAKCSTKGQIDIPVTVNSCENHAEHRRHQKPRESAREGGIARARERDRDAYRDDGNKRVRKDGHTNRGDALCENIKVRRKGMGAAHRQGH